MSTLTYPSTQQNFGWTPMLAGPAITAALYFLGAEAAFFVGTLSDKIFAPFWPPNVVLFIAFMLAPPRLWWLYLAAAFPVHVVAEVGVGMPLAQLLVAFATNAAVALLNAALARYFLGPFPWFESLQKTCLYVAITAAASPAVVALGGAFVPILGGGSLADFWTFWMQWWVSNAISSLALGPLVIAWIREDGFERPQFSSKAIVEASLLTTGTFLICAVAFESNHNVTDGLLPSLLYLPLPLLLWSAIRFGAKGAAGAILVIAVALLWRALQGSSPFTADTPEASVFAIQVFLTALAVPALLLGAAIDETRKAEHATRQSEERMAFAAVAVDVALWHFNYPSEQFWITEHGRKMFGFPPISRLTRQSIFDRIHPDDRESARAAIRLAAASDHLVNSEFRIQRRDGATRWIRARARAERNSKGETTKISGTFIDITVQKAAENESAQQKRDLAHLMRVSMLGTLSGSIAHELTQPLTAILSNAQAAKLLMEKSEPDLTEIACALDDIIAEDNRAGAVIHHMRNLLKKGETKLELVDVNDLITATLQLVANELIRREIKSQVELADDMPLASADPVQLQQVLLNLVMNAIEAMADLPASRRLLIVRTRAREGEITIDVSDRGVGIAAPHREHVFKPFYSTKEQGLGLGLVICASIIKAHGGSLALNSNRDEGATATLILSAENRRVHA
jgi:two-component system, LuxR family, sensor kinase FixL